MTALARSRLTVLTVAAGGLVFFLHLLGAMNGPETWLMRRLSGQEAGLTAAAISMRRSLGAPFKVSDIMKENDELKKRAASADIEIAKLSGVQEENEQLRGLLGFAQKQATAPVIARVIARTPEGGMHTILLDRGSDDGLAADMPVVAAGGVLVGKIFSVQRATAVVLLLTDTRSRVGAEVRNATVTQGLIQGERGLSLEMQLIPQNEEVKIDDLIVTSGIEPLMPKGLVIGRVAEIQTQEKNPFKTAILTSPIGDDRISVVAVPFSS